MMAELGLHSTLDWNCHGQSVYAKFNLNFYYSPPHKQKVWHYEKNKYW